MKLPHFFRYRKLQIDILSIFLSLLLLYSVLTLWYTYKENKETILEFSGELMSQVSQKVETHMNTVMGRMFLLSSLLHNFIEKPEDVSLDNKELISFLITIVQANPRETLFHVAGAQGNWLGAYHVDERFSSLFQKPPADTDVAIQFIDRSKATPKETWRYFNRAAKPISTIEVEEITYDPLQRPWFKGAVATKKPFWTPIYTFALTNKPGITIGNPLFNSEGALIAVTGGDIEVESLSTFLSTLKISPHGKVFILDAEGAAIIPPVKAPRAVRKGWQMYQNAQESSFVFKDEGVAYLMYFSPYHLSAEEWVIALMAPASDFLSDVYATQNKLYLISCVLLIFAIVLVAFFSQKIAKPIVLLSQEIDKIKHLQLEGEVKIKTGIREVQMMKIAVASMKSALRSFGRFIPKEIILTLLEQGKELKLGGEKNEITIFFSDIYDFTSITEKEPTEALLKQLSIYFELVSNLILESKGTIDKYIGDAVMAFWGAPTPLADHSRRACHTALLCQYHLQLQNEKWLSEGKPSLITRIGLHTGTVIVGNIGTAKRMNYTIMGDGVNLAARLEGINKTYKTKIIISEKIKELVAGQFLTRPLDVVAVKGKTEKVKIYELMAELNGSIEIAPTKEHILLSKQFEEAFSCYEQGNYREAYALFKALHELYPSDHPTQIYLERLKNHL